MDARDMPVYIMRAAADLAGAHPQTLRMYERKGLVNPHRTAKGQRQYSDSDIETIREIRKLTREGGVNLAGVRIILSQRERMRELERRIAELEKQIGGM